MRDQDDIVFVEVRTRRTRAYGSALESIDQHKINKLIRAASHFLIRKNWLNHINSRIDVVTVQFMEGSIQFDWIKNAISED